MRRDEIEGFARAAPKRVFQMRCERYRPQPEHRMHTGLRSRNHKRWVGFVSRRAQPADKVRGEEGRVGCNGDDEAALPPVRLRPGEAGMDPASGPIWPARRSGTSGNPNAAKRRGSPLALSTTSATCGTRRSMTWSSNGRPPSGSSALSPPPMRLDLPPARTTPIVPSGVCMPGHYDLRRQAVTPHRAPTRPNPYSTV